MHWLAFTAWVAVAGASPDLDALHGKIDALLEKEFALTKRSESPEMIEWQSTHTQLFPAAWPPDGRAVTFAYAWRVKTGGSPDTISTPWARVLVSGKTLVFERLADQLEEAGTQTRPAPCTKECGAEWRRLTAQVELGALTSRTGPFESPEALKVITRFREQRPVVADFVVRQLPAFFAWLDSRRAKPPARRPTP